MADNVSKPAHYTSNPSGVECIEITRQLSFCLGNAIKYIWRHRDKGSPVVDLRKAARYLRWENEDFTRFANSTSLSFPNAQKAWPNGFLWEMLIWPKLNKASQHWPADVRDIIQSIHKRQYERAAGECEAAAKRIEAESNLPLSASTFPQSESGIPLSPEGSETLRRTLGTILVDFGTRWLQKTSGKK